MFPLAGKDYPTSSDALASAVAQPLAEVFDRPGGAGGAVTVTGGGAFPALASVAVDLDGARVRTGRPPRRPAPAAGDRRPGVTVDRLTVSARPVLYGQAKANLSLDGSGLVLDFARDAGGNPLLLLASAADGRIEASVGRDDLRALLLSAANEAAKAQGVAVQDIQLDLTSDGPRSVAAVVRVKAKKLFLSGTIVLRGRADVDDALVATVSGLSCTGEGAFGTIAAGIVQPKLSAHEGRRVELMALSLGDVKLRDLAVDVRDGIAVSARFGGAA